MNNLSKLSETPNSCPSSPSSPKLVPTKEDLETIRSFATLKEAGVFWLDTENSSLRTNVSKESLEGFYKKPEDLKNSAQIVLLDNLADSPIPPDVEITRRETIDGDVSFIPEGKFVMRSGTPMFGTSIKAGKAVINTGEVMSRKAELFMKLQYILANIEEILSSKFKMIPNNNPIQLYPNGKIRLSRIGTFPSIDEAHKAVSRAMGYRSQSTLPGKKGT